MPNGCKVSGIYKIVNKMNGKYYIGSSIDIEGRLGGHRKRLERGNHDNPHLQNAWNKYGGEAFTFKFVEEVLGGKEARFEHEQGYLNAGFSNGVLYNVSTEASGGSGPHSQEAKAKISKALTGREFSEAHKANISKAKSNPSEETRAKIGRASKGRKPSKEARAKMSKSQIGRKASKETRAKLSKAKMGENNPNYGRDMSGENSPWSGEHHTEETKARISESVSGENNPFYGRHHTEESLIKIREGAAKPYPAFYNDKTEEFIPAGRDLLGMSRELGLSHAVMYNLKVGLTGKSGNGWRLATISEMIASKGVFI